MDEFDTKKAIAVFQNIGVSVRKICSRVFFRSFTD